MSNSIEPRDLAAQLRCPSGANAPEVGQRMNGSNGELNRKCIELLSLAPGHEVLEIGPGNGAFAGTLVATAEGITYTGLDWSADMVEEARSLNMEGITRGEIRFQQGDAAQLPFPDASFDRVLSTHTLYFWEPPQSALAEIRRVLKPGGLFCLAFGDRGFMQNLPFTGFGFNLHDRESVEPLLDEAGFPHAEWLRHFETGPGNAGGPVEKEIHIALAQA